MEILKKAKIPIIITVLLIISFFVYNTVFKQTESTSGLEREGEKNTQSGTKNPSRDFSSLLTLIKSVDFDDKFFADSTFRSLVDFSEDVRKEDAGRNNPFAPGIVNSFSNIEGVRFDSGDNTGSTTPPKTQSTATSTNQQ